MLFKNPPRLVNGHLEYVRCLGCRRLLDRSPGWAGQSWGFCECGCSSFEIGHTARRDDPAGELQELLFEAQGAQQGALL